MIRNLRVICNFAEMDELACKGRSAVGKYETVTAIPTRTDELGI